VGAALEPSGFSPGVSQRELWELERGFPELELLLFIIYPADMTIKRRIHDDQ
jgi:hypothetical protein